MPYAQAKIPCLNPVNPQNTCALGSRMVKSSPRLLAGPLAMSSSSLAARRHQRRDLAVPVTIVLGKGNILPGFTEDVGEGGIRALFSQPVEVGTRVIIEVNEFGDHRRLCTLALVRHRDGLVHGLEFTVLSSAQRETLVRICSACKEASA